MLNVYCDIVSGKENFKLLKQKYIFFFYTFETPMTVINCNAAKFHFDDTSSKFRLKHKCRSWWEVRFLRTAYWENKEDVAFRFTFGQKRVLKVNWISRHWRGLTMKSFWEMFLQNYALWSIMITMIILSKFGVHFWIYIVSWRSLTLKIFLKNVKGG